MGDPREIEMNPAVCVVTDRIDTLHRRRAANHALRPPRRGERGVQRASHPRAQGSRQLPCIRWPHRSDFQLRTLDEVAGKRVVVLGYGKSACDAAVEVARCAHTTTLVAKDFFWKLPTYIGGVLHYSYLLLTRVVSAMTSSTNVSGSEQSGADPPLRERRCFRGSDLGGLNEVMDTIGSPLRRSSFHP